MRSPQRPIRRSLPNPRPVVTHHLPDRLIDRDPGHPPQFSFGRGDSHIKAWYALSENTLRDAVVVAAGTVARKQADPNTAQVRSTRTVVRIDPSVQR